MVRQAYTREVYTKVGTVTAWRIPESVDIKDAMRRLGKIL